MTILIKLVQDLSGATLPAVWLITAGGWWCLDKLTYAGNLENLKDVTEDSKSLNCSSFTRVISVIKG